MNPWLDQEIRKLIEEERYRKLKGVNGEISTKEFLCFLFYMSLVFFYI